MKVLAIETSCDDTAAAVVAGGNVVLSNVRKSQTAHANWGGVVPELAARAHADEWKAVVDQALAEAQTNINEIEKIAVTAGPGLMGSLLTGATAAGFLSALYQIPVQPVQHIWGHICSVALGRKWTDLQLPALCLTVSGGHTMLLKIESYTSAMVLSNTRDDAAGEAFDKVARALGLTYPGGPIVSQLAELGDPRAFALPHPLRHDDDFSFSGLKAAVTRHLEHIGTPSESQRNNLCAGFQRAIVDIFRRKVERFLARDPSLKQLWFVGGVSANTQLREALSALCAERGLGLLIPTEMSFCTDNAAMIAAAAHAQKNAAPCGIGPIVPTSRLGLSVADLADRIEL